MNDHFLKMFIAAVCFVAALILIACFRPAFAEPTDWYDNDVSEQISREARAKAKREAGIIWQNEHGIFQRNLTAEEDRELMKKVTQIQLLRSAAK